MSVLCNPLSLDDSLSHPVSDATDAPSPGSDGLGDSLYPGFGNGGYDAQSYTLNLNITDVATSYLTATTTISAKATQSLSSFNLDFIGFEISGITVNDQPAAYSRIGQELTVIPAAPLLDGSDFHVAVSYSGSPEPITSVALPVLTGLGQLWRRQLCAQRT